MRPSLIPRIAVLALLSIPAFAQNKYVGVETCARCHGTAQQGDALHQWRNTSHAGAFRTLQTHSESEARKCQDLELWIVEIGRGVKYGLPRPAAESKECLPCHVTAFGADANSVAASFDRRDGVQCESCHGPGSGHVEARTRKDAGASLDGLIPYEDERAIKARCKTCHEGTCGDFDFDRMWPKIKHTSAGR